MATVHIVKAGVVSWTEQNRDLALENTDIRQSHRFFSVIQPTRRQGQQFFTEDSLLTNYAAKVFLSESESAPPHVELSVDE
jgi:hypothetical protein